MMNINKQIIKKQFDKHFETYESNATVQQIISEKLMSLLKRNTFIEFDQVLEVGCGTGFLTRQILSNCKMKKLYINDFTCSALSLVKQNLQNNDICCHEFLHGDAELIPFPNQLNAILSTSTVQWFKNLSLFFSKVSASLNRGGIFAFSTFGVENLKEIKALTGIGLDYKSLSELINMLMPDFDILVTKEWKMEKEFGHPTDVLRHIKYTGVNGVQKVFFGKKQLSSFVNGYMKLYSPNKQNVILTYNPIIIIATKN